MKDTSNSIKKGFSPKPFVKWAGGKKWLTSKLDNFLPKKYNNYHEPFLGGGAVFFYLRPPNYSFLSDLNPDLINAFKQIKKDPNILQTRLSVNDFNEIKYYQLRDTTSSDKVFNAAKFIILNKTCFNGIYRVNKSGIFNVPYGHNTNAKIFKSENLIAIHNLLKKTRLNSHDFSKSLVNIERGDLVFLDPPYTVAHNNNGFIEYNQKIFSWEDQERLADFVDQIIRKGAYYIITNAVHPRIVNLYKQLGDIYELGRYSTITSKIKMRRKISEYLITNCT